MASIETRLAALERVGDDDFEIVRLLPGQDVKPEKGERVITIVRSYGQIIKPNEVTHGNN